MANSIASSEPVSEINLSSSSNPNPNEDDFNSLQFPPLDLDYLSNDLSFPDAAFVSDLFDDDFDFSFDDISFPENPENLPNIFPSSDHTSPSPPRDSDQEESGGSKSVVNGFLNSPSLESAVDSTPVDSSHSPNSLSSQNSSSSNVVVVDEANVNGTVEKIEVKEVKEEEGKEAASLKRKKYKEEESPVNSSSSSSKIRRSLGEVDSKDSNKSINNEVDEEDKRRARLMRNRESAQLSRQRKKHYVEELEDKVKSLHSVIADLNNKVSFFMAENAGLRQQLMGVGGGGGAPVPPGVYPPIAPMGYPWYPYPIKPQGSQVPLVPIPRLKPQQPVSASKAKKAESGRKTEGGRTSKTKKVASVSFLGLLFFVLLFGGLVPMVDVNYATKREMGSNGFGFGSDSGVDGRIFTVNGSNNRVGVGLHGRKPGIERCGDSGRPCKRGLSEGVGSKTSQGKAGSQPLPSSDGFAPMLNSSEHLVASLYVPRNDKLVKIDGNLIINSVIASEKAVASSRPKPGVKSDKATVSSTEKNSQSGLAIAGKMAPALPVASGGRDVERHPHVYRLSNEHQKALHSGERDGYKEKSKSADGSLQKWFREGLEGPIFSTGMCTEVFQFDTSPASAAPGAIVPAASAVNASAKSPPSRAHMSKRNRRILSHLPITLDGSEFNSTDKRAGRPSQDGNFHGNDTASSMVVSVLVDPRENGDGDSEGVISQKSMSRIFVVVLMDSVKYVTYSCILPLKGSGPHLVTT